MLSRPHSIHLAALVYVLLHLVAQLTASIFEVGPGISLWYPPAGLALAAVILLGPRAFPYVFVANVVGAWLTSQLPTWWSPWLFPALITLNYGGVGWLARRATAGELLPGSWRGTAWFAGMVLLAPLLIAAVGTSLLPHLGVTANAPFHDRVLSWWVGDAMGILTVLPAALVWLGPYLSSDSRARARLSPGRASETAAQVAAVGVALWIIFALDPIIRPHALYLTFLPLVWIASRWGLPGATAASLALTMGCLFGLHVAQDPEISLVGLLLFQSTLNVVGLGLGSAVSRRNAAEARLLASETRLERVVTGAQAGLWDWERPSDVLTLNAPAAAMAGNAAGASTWADWENGVLPAERASLRHALRAHLEGSSPVFDCTYRMRTAAGEIRWIHTRGSIVARSRTGEPLRLSGTHLDVTEKWQAIVESRRLLQILEATTDFVLTVDRSGRTIWCNGALLRLLGRAADEAPVGRPLREVFPATTAEFLAGEVIPAATRWGVWQGEVIVRDAAGHDLPTLLVALAHRDDETDRASVSLVLRDISRLREAEAENLQNLRRIQDVQRAESLGVLAGGIAHDFNNLLSAILGNANLARLAVGSDAAAQERLTNIEANVARAAELCQQMLAYAGRAPVQLADIDLVTLVSETVHLLQSSLPRKVALELALPTELPTVRATPAQIQQLVMNLVLNAAEAIGEREGRVLVRARAERLTADALNQRFRAPTLPEGEYVVVEVEDSGRGIPPDALNRVFEPFYSTKFAGHGLGLAAALGIARTHGGTISVTSEVGRGSTFRLLLPASAAPIPERQLPLRLETNDWRGRGLALVVDDEDAVRQTACELMESLGFTTISARDGTEALQQLQREGDRLAVVLLDMTMPRLDGEETLRALRQSHPRLPVLLMSGFSDRLDAKRLQELRPSGVLGKPFHRRGLQAQLRQILGAAGTEDTPTRPPA